jgi:hypothetical protein
VQVLEIVDRPVQVDQLGTLLHIEVVDKLAEVEQKLKKQNKKIGKVYIF